MKDRDELLAAMHQRDPRDAARLLYEWVKTGQVKLRDFTELLIRAGYLFEEV